MVCRYSVSSMSATWAPTLRSNVTRPSASSRRIASRTGTTLTSSSLGDRAEHEPVARHVAAVVDALADEAVGRCDLLSASSAAPRRHRLAAPRVVARPPLGVHGEQPVDGCPAGDLLGDPRVLAPPARAPRRPPPRRGAGGITMTPSPSPTITSPGCTAAPPHAIVDVDLPRHVPAAEHARVRALREHGDAERRRRRRSRARRRR